MTSVLVFIVIPNPEFEQELREQQKNLKNESPNSTEEKEEQKSLEKIVQDGLATFDLLDATMQKSLNENYLQILFAVDMEDSDNVIEYFKSQGIGLYLNSSIGIIPFSLFFYNENASQSIGFDKTNDNELDNFKEKQNKFLKSVTARLTVAQIVNSVRSDSSITFDFICYLVFASWIAAMGLLDNSVICLVASMLVSPMMGPVMAFTFGAIIKERSLRNQGLRNILVCLLITISFGVVFGLIALNFTEQWTRSFGSDSTYTWPTDMMKERGMLRVLWVGTLVAFPSGCAVAISLLSGNNASLVGVAISVSLLPPAVNTGLLWAFSLLKYLHSINEPLIPVQSRFEPNKTILLPFSLKLLDTYKPVHSDNISIETLTLGALSLALSVINILNIIFGAWLLLKVKEIAPLSSMLPEKKFFQDHIRIAREYNMNSETGNMEEDVFREWAKIAGFNSNELNPSEVRKIQMQTLLDIAKDVEADQIYQTVTKNIKTDNLTRRLSQGNFIDPDRRPSTLSVMDNGPSIRITDFSRRPSNVFGLNRRRISTVALNLRPENDNLSPKRLNAGITNKAFRFDEMDNQPQPPPVSRIRRNSSAVLRMTLQNSEHSPYSVWPSTRFSVTNINTDPNPDFKSNTLNPKTS